MAYSTVLRNIIAEANITQEELSNKCKQLGANISRVQINKLVNNKVHAPNEETSRAIAKVCNVDDRELVIEGYLEYAPKEFIEFLNKFQDTSMSMTLDCFQKELTKEELDIIKKEYRKETLAKVILETIDEKLNEDYTENLLKIAKNNELFKEQSYLIMQDNSMENKIPKNSKLRLKTKEKYKNGDIVLVKVKNQDMPIIRMAIFIGRDICLYAFNNEYTSLLLTPKEYKILAYVDSIEIKI